MGRENETAMFLSPDQFAQLLSAAKGGNSADPALLAALEVLKQTTKKRENETHHGKSIFSYPEGDLEKPRPVLPFQLFWQGYPVHENIDGVHWLELELLARLTPGEYRVSLANNEGTQKVTVTGMRDADEALTRLEVRADGMSREQARQAPPIAVWVYQMLHQDEPMAETYLAGTTLFMQHIVMQKPPAETVSA